MTLTSSVTPGVLREVPTCDNLSTNAHALLALLTRTRSTNKGYPRVKGDLDSWSRTLAIPRHTLSLVFEDLRDVEHEFVRKDSQGRWVLWILCECPAGKKTDSSIPLSGEETEQSGRRGAPELATPVSSPAPCGRKRESDEEDETPGQSTETCFPEMADEDDETPRPRPKVNPDGPFALACYFQERVILSAQKQGIRVMPGSINREALMRHIRVLLTDLSPDDVRGLIDFFAKGYRRYHKPGVDPGKVFLARRRGLYEEHRKARTYVTERDINKFMSNGRRYTTLADIQRRKNS